MPFNFSKDEVIILDFDNTIWIWRRDIIYSNMRPDFTMSRLMKESVYTPRYGFVPKRMRELIEFLTINRVEYYVLTAAKTSMESLDKQVFMDDEFGTKPSHVISVSSPEHKTEIIEGLMRIHKDKKFTLIDDRIETLKECKHKLGITVYHPLEILTD